MTETKPPRPWRCPRDHTCPSPHHHDTARGHKAGCRSGAARAGISAVETERRGGRRPTLVNGLGTARRLRALHAIGHSDHMLAVRIDISHQRVARLRHHFWARIMSTCAHDVAWLYDELSEAPGGNQRAINCAKRHGEQPPEAWDGLDIDDPEARPWTGRASETELTVVGDEALVSAARHQRVAWDELSVADREHVVAGLKARGYTGPAIAELLRTTKHRVETVSTRLYQRALRASHSEQDAA